MAGLMDGYTIVDLTWGIAGPAAGMLFADHGADVIKIEQPGGDPFRSLKPYRVWQRGKRSAILDLKSDEGRENLLQLCERADILMESFSPGVMAKLGLDYETIKERCPHLVFLSISGHGQTGPRRDLPAYDPLVAARMGIHYEQVGPRPGPHFNVFPLASYGTALLGLIGITTALLARERTGKGQHVETSLEDGILTLMTMFWNWSDQEDAFAGIGGQTGRMVGRSMMGLGIMPCADGKYMQIHTGAPGRFQRALEVFGLDDRVTPSTTPHEMGEPLTPEEAALIQSEVPRLLKSKPRAYWIEKIQNADIATMEVDPPGGVLNDPQAIHNKSVVEFNDSELGPIKTVGTVLMVPGAPPEIRGPAPDAGQHTDEILKNLGSSSKMTSTTEPSVKTGAAPLEGLRVLDFGAYFAGPYGPKQLADLGAEVIKIEPFMGDPMRTIDGPFRACQRGKRCIALDLKSSEGNEIAHKLIKNADIVTHNMRPGVAERLGIGYEQVKEIKPDIVYLAAPGWGTSGPKSHLQSFAPLFSGLCGMQWSASGKGNPPMPTVSNEDYFNSLLGAGALLMGLLNRNRTKKAQYLEGPQLNSTLFATSDVILGPNDEPVFHFEVDAQQFGYGPLCRLYETADDWLTIVVANDKEWQALTSISGLEALADDPRFVNTATRAENGEALAETLSQWFKAHDTKTARGALDAAGVPCEESYPLQTKEYFLQDENMESGRVAEYNHPKFGRMRDAGQTIRFSDTPGIIRGPCPILGEHTREILGELGYGSDEIAALRENNIINWQTVEEVAAEARAKKAS